MKLFQIIAVILLTYLAFSVKSKQISVDVYGKLPDKSLIAISPNAKRLAYRDTSNNSDIIVVLDLETYKVIAAAHLTEVNPNQLYFVNDNTVILTATDNIRITGYRGRHDTSWAYAFNLETKKIHSLLTQGYGIYTGQTQLGEIVGLSADKQYAYMPAYQSAGVYNLYKVNLREKRKPRIHQKGNSDTRQFFVGDDGEVLARERYNNHSNVHRVEARVNDEWQVIYRDETDIKTKGFSGLTPDKKSLVFRQYNQETDRTAYFTMSLADGSISEPLFSRPDKDVEYLLTDLNSTVYGVKYSGFTPNYEFFDDVLNARMRGLKKALPDNGFTIKDYTPDWNNIVFYLDGKESSGDYLLYNSGSLSLLAASRPEIPPESVNDVVEYSFKARDGLTIPTLLTIPLNKKVENLPAILMPHGGPFAYDTKTFNYRAQYFASQGYLVIQPQFRGSDGFGWEHSEKGHGEWGRKMQDDLTDSISSLSKEGKIDSKRVCIVGASYGGYAALAGAVFTPDLYKCVVSINGVSDIEDMIKSERREHGSDHWVITYWEKIIAEGTFKETHLAEISPINHVNKIKSPILLIHGELDEVVPISQSKDMLEELEDANKTVDFIELEDGDHYLSKATNRMTAMRAIAEFVKKHI